MKKCAQQEVHSRRECKLLLRGRRKRIVDVVRALWSALQQWDGLKKMMNCGGLYSPLVLKVEQVFPEIASGLLTRVTKLFLLVINFDCKFCCCYMYYCNEWWLVIICEWLYSFFYFCTECITLYQPCLCTFWFSNCM